jgi:NlpE N-terminal domain
MTNTAFRLILFFVTLLAAGTSNAQTANPFTGTWKVIGFGNGDMQINLKSKTAESKDMPTLDSALIKAMFDAMKSSMGDWDYSFSSYGQYKLNKNNELSEKGTYKIDRDNSMFTLTTVRNNQKVTEEYRYFLQNNQLILIDLNEDSPITLVLEKLD